MAGHNSQVVTQTFKPDTLPSKQAEVSQCKEA